MVPAATLYVLLWIAVAGNWAWLDGADNWILRQFHRVGAHQAGWIGFWEAVSDVLSPTALRVVALGVIIAALIRRSTSTVVFLLLTVGGMGLVTVAAKALVGLARVALNVHHPSDVVAGWALGLLYFLLCMAVLHRWVPRPSAQRQDPDLVSVD